MRRIRRKSRLHRPGALTPTQECELTTGLSVGKDGFASPAEAKKAWFFHRDRLMAESGPLNRPDAFWIFEHDRSPRRGEQVDLLLSLSIELTGAERSILTKQPPFWIPDEVPSSALAIQHWQAIIPSMETRSAWHAREGRAKQAQAWKEQADTLAGRILTTEITEKETRNA